MIYPEELAELVGEVYANELARINTKYLTMIAERIRKIGALRHEDFHRLARLREYGADFEAMEREIAALTGRTSAAIHELIERAAADAYNDFERLAEVTGQPLIPYAENETLRMTVEAISRETAGTFRNLSNTTAIGYSVRDGAGNIVFRGAGEAYQDAVDRAIHEVTQGVSDFPAAMRSTLHDLAGSGLRRVDYASGNHRRLDSAARMNILDGTRAVYQGIQDQVGDRLGCDGVELSAHGTCAPDHLPFQGKQYSLADFDELQSSLARPFGMWNCRHSWKRIILGVSVPAYSDAELAELRRLSTELIEFEGKEMTRYEATQLQRRIETGVRSAKDRANLAAASGDDVWRRSEQLRINQLTAKYQELSEAAGLPTRRERMSVGGFRPVRAAGKQPEFMSRWEKSAVDWTGIEPKEHTIETIRFLKDEATRRNILLRNVDKFDGDESMLMSVIRSIGDFQIEFPRVNPKNKRIILDIGMKMPAWEFADIEGFRIRVNRYALYDPEILRRNMKGFFAGETIEELIWHELGHLIEPSYHVSGLDVARKAIMEVSGREPSNAEIISYLLNYVSQYSVDATEMPSTEKLKTYYNEIIPEVLSGKDRIPGDFYRAFIEALRRREKR